MMYDAYDILIYELYFGDCWTFNIDIIEQYYDKYYISTGCELTYIWMIYCKHEISNQFVLIDADKHSSGMKKIESIRKVYEK